MKILHLTSYWGRTRAAQNRLQMFNQRERHLVLRKQSNQERSGKKCCFLYTHTHTLGPACNTGRQVFSDHSQRACHRGDNLSATPFQPPRDTKKSLVTHYTSHRQTGNWDLCQRWLTRDPWATLKHRSAGPTLFARGEKKNLNKGQYWKVFYGMG